MEMEMEMEMVVGVKMESRGKLGNDEKVKFVGTVKSVRWREKTCGSQDICKLLLYFPIFTFHFHFLTTQTGP